LGRGTHHDDDEEEDEDEALHARARRTTRRHGRERSRHTLCEATAWTALPSPTLADVGCRGAQITALAAHRSAASSKSLVTRRASLY
jgi:hypothetical protein